MKSKSKHLIQRGFTLIEMLIVMAIIVILATLVISAYSYVETTKREKSAEQITTRVSQALEEYHRDFGIYPYGTEAQFNSKSTKAMTEADGSEYSSNVIYKALYGDYLDKGVPAKKAHIYYEELEPSKEASATTLVTPINVRDKQGKQRTIHIMRDPWGEPYRYTLGFGQSLPNKPTETGKGVNPDFDFWSLGKDSEEDQANPHDPTNEDNIGNQPKAR